MPNEVGLARARHDPRLLSAARPPVSKRNDKTGEFNIAGLAEASGVSIRNIRAYRARNLLQAPERRGRYSIYTQAHVTRLRTIGSLLKRGYTMANIDELLSAWQAGHDIAGVLGLETADKDNFGQQDPEPMSLGDLNRMFDHELRPDLLKRLVDVGYLAPRGKRMLALRPQMLSVGAELARMGVPLSSLINMVEELKHQFDQATTSIVEAMGVAEEGLATQGDASTAELAHVADAAWKLRTLLDLSITSELADSLRRALEQRFGQQLPEQLDRRSKARQATPR